MSADTQASIAKNWNTVLNNFKKITAWIIKGETEDNPMKGALKEAKDKFEDLIANDKEQDNQLDVLATTADDHKQLIQHLNQQIESLKNTVADLDTRLNNLGDPANPVEVPKPKAKPKAKPEPKPEPVKDEVVVTAEAIGAGDLSESATAMVDDLLDSL